MTRSRSYRPASALIGLALLLAAGCVATPQSRQTVRMRDLTTPQARKAAANHFWLRTNVPDLRGLGYRRIAIAEFAVEFVTAKRELTTDLEDYLRTHPEDQARASGAVQNIEISYPNEFDYPAMLYDLLCKDLTQRGFEVVPLREVAAAPSYNWFEGTRESFMIQMEDAYASASDTGRVQRLSIRPLPGLVVVRGGGDRAVETVEQALREELRADVVLRIRVRLGAFSGHATLERGSVIHVDAPHVSGTITAERSLISEEWVLAERQQALGGWQARVSLPQYWAAVRTMFPTFIAMAFDSADAAPRPSPAPRP